MFFFQLFLQSCELALPQSLLLLLLALPSLPLLSALLALLPYLCLDLFLDHLLVTIQCSSTRLKQSSDMFGVLFLLCFIHW